MKFLYLSYAFCLKKIILRNILTTLQSQMKYLKINPFLLSQEIIIIYNHNIFVY